MESKKDPFQEMARGMGLIEGRKMDAHTKDQGVGTPRTRLDGLPPYARPRVLWSVSSHERA